MKDSATYIQNLRKVLLELRSLPAASSAKSYSYSGQRRSYLVKNRDRLCAELKKHWDPIVVDDLDRNSRILLEKFRDEGLPDDKLSDLLDRAESWQVPKEKESLLSFLVPSRLPDDIRDDVVADIRELEKCYQNDCFRSCIILCGRILEAVLHRIYFERTNFDILEKNPGIGLGTLIAKMDEKGIKLDPGLTQQIHLINQVRVFSVHKKKEAFYPSKAQTQAIILFTMDIVTKFFG